MKKFKRILSVILVFAIMLMGAKIPTLSVMAAGFEEDSQLGYEKYVVNELTMEDTGDGIRVKGKSNDDHVIKVDPINVKNTEVTFTMEKQPPKNNSTVIGFTNSYIKEDGAKVPVLFQKSDGNYLTNYVVMKVTAEDKIEVKFLNSVENPNPKNGVFKGYQEVSPKKELVAEDGTFVGKQFKVTTFHDGNNFILTLKVDGTTYLRDGVAQSSNVMSVKISSEEGAVNCILLDRFANDEGYLVVNPGGWGTVKIDNIAETTTAFDLEPTPAPVVEEKAEVVEEAVVAPVVIEPTKVKKELGKFNNFWSGHPLLGEFEGAAIREVPDFLADEKLSFPYPKLDLETEVTYGKNLNLVRFLGGWKAKGRNFFGTNLGEEGVAEYDLAYRDEDGKIQYRFGEDVPDEENFAKRRLDPYMERGYTNMRIVLDNVPRCFVENPIEGKYGQGALPDNDEEWADFVKAVCEELVRLYGYELVNTWSFRLFTEADNNSGRIYATAEEYAELYEVTANAVNEVLPGAGFGAYNSMYDLDEHMITVAKHAKENNLKFDWIGISDYFKSPAQDPDVRINKIKEDLDKIRAVAPNGDKIPFEIHEYIWLAHVEGLRVIENGARGAAGNFHWLMNLYEIGLDSMYHWNVTDKLTIKGPDDTVKTDDKTYTFINGAFWTYTIFEQAVGANAYDLYLKTPENMDEKQQYKAVGFFGADSGKNMVVMSSYNMDRANLFEGDVTVYIPKTVAPDLSDKVIKYTSMDDDHDMFRALKNDLIAGNVLVEERQLKEGVVGSISQMINANKEKIEEGKEILVKNYPKYQALAEESLTLKDYDGKVVDKGEYYEITAKLRSPQTLVLSFEDKKADTQEAVEFTDLDQAAWATEYVEYLADKDIVEGVTATEFAPNEKVTRDVYIAMLVRGYGLVDETATTTFTDVKADAKYYAEIATAEKLGITKGIGGSQFGSGQSITREQMATMITRALEVLGKELKVVKEKATFSDDAGISSYAKESVYNMQKAGILEGKGEGIYAPKETATRAQAAKVIYYLVK